MTNTEANIFLIAFIGFFGPLLIYGILKLTKRNLDNHKNIDIFLALVMFISGITLGIFFYDSTCDYVRSSRRSN